MLSKTCSSCNTEKPLSLFNKQDKAADGHQAYCRDCQRTHKRAIRYGVSADWFDAKMKEQGCRCAVCGMGIEEYLGRYKGARVSFDVDHCHTSGKARGLLCNRCNMVLGQVDDNVDLLKHMIRYLRKHKI